MGEELKQVLQKFNEFGYLKKEIQTRLGLLLYSKSYPREKLELVLLIAEVNQHLETLYAKVKQERTKSRNEQRYLELIREFEDRRFQLLNQLNGDCVDEYGMLPLQLPE